MGNLCSNDNPAVLTPTIQSDILTAWKKHTLHTTAANAAHTTPSHTPVRVPKLMDMCLDQLCNAIAFESNVSLTTTVNKARSNSISNAATSQRTRTWSVSDVDSPVLLPHNYTPPSALVSPLPTTRSHSRQQRIVTTQHTPYNRSIAETVLNVATSALSLMSPNAVQRQVERHAGVPTLHLSSVHGLFPMVVAQQRVAPVNINTHQPHDDNVPEHARGRRASSGDYTSSSNDECPSDTDEDTHSINEMTQTATQVALPDIVLQLIFERLVQHRWLNERACQQLSNAKLTSIDLHRYDGLSDNWLIALLSSVQSHRHTSISSAASSAFGSPVKHGFRQSSISPTTPRAIFNHINNRPAQRAALDSPVADQYVDRYKYTSSVSTTLPSAYSSSSIHEPSSSPPPVPGESGSGGVGELSPLLSYHGILSTKLSSSLPGSTASPYLLTTPSTASPLPGMIDTFTLNQPVVSVNTLVHFNISHCDQITDAALQQLQYCMHLQTLNVSGCTQLSDASLTRVLLHKPHLTYFNASGCVGVSNTSVDCLADCSELQTLVLDETGISDHAMHGLHTLYKLTKLRKFSIAWCRNNVSASGLYWLNNNADLTHCNISHTRVESFMFLTHCANLKHLNISGLKLIDTARQFHSVTYKLDELVMSRCKLRETTLPVALLHHGLKRLDMSFMHVSANKLAAALNYVANTTASHKLSTSALTETAQRDRANSEPVQHSRAVEPPAASFRRAASLVEDADGDTSALPQLSTLDLESTFVDINGMRAIARLRNLVDLNISDTVTDNEGMHELRALTSLQSLNLNGCKISSLTSVSEMTSLQHLHIDCPSVTDNALSALAKLTQLRTLDMFEAYVTDNCVPYLLPLKQLQSLQICSGKLTNIALTTISTALVELTDLNISHSTAINDNGITALTCLTKLRHINLSGTSVTAAGLVAVNDMIKLQTVSVYDTKLTAGDIQSHAIRPGVIIASNDTVFSVIDHPT